MAELDVEPKKKSILPWILLAVLVLAAIAYFVWNSNRVDNTTAAPATYDTTVRADTSRVPGP